MYDKIHYKLKKINKSKEKKKRILIRIEEGVKIPKEFMGEKL